AASENDMNFSGGVELVQRNQLHEVVGVRRVDEREDVLFFL
ncbi:MAG: hypothetical protein QG574_4386, partial [Cyanobacteriota bacterium erpe_2018_sw_21hr_WHONDRS-SW48-000092_B_bin.40]|nr:hypothetical protein [Cyanobacteriota bacterium erpe_2018_sw_21hr_WHONDRS-SW48-000092_B_bin.40]